ncbi:nuclease-related domain-containing protein [Mucilaginibacter sp. UYCu711]|uniref:nuclease-related domain-containing protein n=1 Tax=Mucilaginibacter sp. UYCu711 TaxID=3156339 RepID=UPI003D245C15
MCKVYNTIGCLTTIKAHLRTNNVKGYQSVNELITFKENYIVKRQQIISNHQPLIDQERNLLAIEVVELNEAIKAKKIEVEYQLTSSLESLKHRLENLSVTKGNLIQTIICYIKKIRLKQEIDFHKHSFNSKISDAVENLAQEYNKKNDRFQFLNSSPEVAVMQSCSSELQELDRQKNIIDEINNSIYGAIGEQKVVRELEKLNDDYILINDFTCNFHPAIYNKNENDYIKSVQIDHLLIAPSGIFLIETKNWSEQSLHNLNLYSPVQQIKRANFAIYRILNGEFSNQKLRLKEHHWGDRKVSIRNLIVLINHKPIEEFKYVKILTADDLIRYVSYFDPCFSKGETQMIANHLLRS